MDELIDVVDRSGNPTGKAVLKSEIHKKGYYHNTAHLWLFTSEGQILLQQRAATKTICPLLWDVSVAGHIDAGETPEKGIIRETKEEIGLDISEEHLNKIGVFECFQSYENGIIDNEFHHTYIAETHKHINELIPQKDEVEALKYVSLQEFELLLEHIGTNNHFVATNVHYYNMVLNAIAERINQSPH